MIFRQINILGAIAGTRTARILAGTIALLALVGASNAAADNVKVAAELRCLALNIYFEARNEPDTGMIAVGQVVLNRVDDSRFPPTVCAVVRQGGARPKNRCQFSWWCDGLSDRPTDKGAWARSQALAFLLYWGFVNDTTGGALWYHADYVKPHWRTSFEQGAKFGRHLFYRRGTNPDLPPFLRTYGRLGLRF